MKWIAPFRDVIAAQAPRLQQHGFSWIGEDDNSIRFTDGDVLLTFCVERYDDKVSAWVRHLGDDASDDEYRLGVVMQVMDGAKPQEFAAKTPDEWANLIVRYVDYVLVNKKRLFSGNCPYEAQYSAYERELMAKLKAQQAPKP